MPDYALPPARAQHYYAALTEQANLQKASVKELAVSLRQLLEQVLEEATDRFAYRVDFDGAYSRLVFAQQELALPESVAARAHAARRHLNQLVHGRMAEDDFKVSLPLGATAALVESLSGEGIPDKLQRHLPASAGYAAQAAERRRQETTGWIRFVVTGLPDLFDDEAEMLLLEGYAETGYGQADKPIKVLLNRHRDTKDPKRVLRDFTYLAQMAWPYARLNLYKLREHEEAPGLLHTQLESEIILDPDFLVDASDLAGCFSGKTTQPLAFIIKKLVPQPPKGSLFKGSIVNDLLDGILQQPGLNYKKAFGQIVKDNFIKTACLGRKELGEIFSSIEEDHLHNLQAFAKHYEGQAVATEPSYISPKYGLSGRMDIVIHDPDLEPTRWEVIELKSGKPPRSGAWEEHAAQATVYNMLLDSVADELGYPGRTGATEVFYSQADTKGRVVPINPSLREAILRCRNYIVAMLRQLRKGNMQALTVIGQSEEVLSNLLRFDREAILAIVHAYLKAAPAIKAYYETWMAFLLREFACAKTGEALANPSLRDASVGGHAGLWRDTLTRKRARFEALEPLVFLDIDEENRAHFAYTPPPEAHCSLREGDILVVYPYILGESFDGEQAALLQPGAYQLAKGTLFSIEPGRIVIDLKSRVLGRAYFERHAYWMAEPDQMDSGHWHSLSALFNFLQADDHKPGLQSLVLGETGPALPNTGPVVFKENARLLPSQRGVVEAAVCAQDYFLLQGPPGTGKTSTALPEIITQELARGRRNITILCYTNRALEEVQFQLDRLRKEDGIRYLSLKRKARTEEELDALLDGKPFRLERVAQAIGEVRVFLCTISSFLSNVHYLRQLCGSLDLLIVDEASMATEAQLVGLLPFFSKFILIGDENQLPPVVTQSAVHCAVSQDSPLYGLGFRDLRHSLFERMLARCRQAGWAHAHGMLTDHFRMHPLIADLVNPYYNNRLHALSSYADDLQAYHASDEPLCEVLSRGRTLFIETGPGPIPKHHPAEARLAAELTQTICRACPELSIGILSPWRAQNRQITVELENLGLNLFDKSIKVDTIERYQGAERDIIILSTALSEARYLAAMQSVIPREGLPSPYKGVDRKLVVALSRARQQVIILGHAPFLAPDPHYGPILEVLRRRQAFVTRQEVEWKVERLA